MLLILVRPGYGTGTLCWFYLTNKCRVFNKDFKWGGGGGGGGGFRVLNRKGMCLSTGIFLVDNRVIFAL